MFVIRSPSRTGDQSAINTKTQWPSGMEGTSRRGRSRTKTHKKSIYTLADKQSQAQYREGRYPRSLSCKPAAHHTASAPPCPTTSSSQSPTMYPKICKSTILVSPLQKTLQSHSDVHFAFECSNAQPFSRLSIASGFCKSSSVPQPTNLLLFRWGIIEITSHVTFNEFDKLRTLITRVLAQLQFSNLPRNDTFVHRPVHSSNWLPTPWTLEYDLRPFCLVDAGRIYFCFCQSYRWLEEVPLGTLLLSRPAKFLPLLISRSPAPDQCDMNHINRKQVGSLAKASYRPMSL